METTIDPKPKRKYERNFNSAFKRAVEFLEAKGAKPLFYGCHRAAMIRGTVVYKLPRSVEGITANFEEDYFFNKLCKHKEFYVPNRYDRNSGTVLGFARCKLIWIKKIPVLMMERLIPLHLNDFRLTADMKEHDGGQFGETKRGDFLCYDYSRILNWNLPQYPPELREITNAYCKKFDKTYKDNTRWADMEKFSMCCGVPSLDHVKTIRES